MTTKSIAILLSIFELTPDDLTISEYNLRKAIEHSTLVFTDLYFIVRIISSDAYTLSEAISIHISSVNKRSPGNLTNPFDNFLVLKLL
jgi:hypothetical protein